MTGGAGVARSVVTFEADADPSCLVAQYKCALGTSSSLSRMVYQRLRVANALWAGAFGAVAVFVLLWMQTPRHHALIAGGFLAVVYYGLVHVPYNAKRGRQRYEKQILRGAERMARDNAALSGRWRFTVNAAAISFENLTTGSLTQTAMSSVERAELVDGHLCIHSSGEVVGSLPLGDLSLDSERAALRRILFEAGVKGWPEGEGDLV